MTSTLQKKYIVTKTNFLKVINYLSELLPDSNTKLKRDAYEFWNGSLSEERVRDLSHYEGQGRWSDNKAWNSIGAGHLRMFKGMLRYINYDKPIQNMLEWGPGGGANAIHFAKEVEKFYGVDISRNNLKECKNQLEKRNYNTFVPIHIDINNPEYVKDCIGRSIDLFLSTAVYQHFPSKEYGIKITKVAFDLLSVKGFALIQIRYDNDTKKYKPKKNKYGKNAIYFTSYKIEEFLNIVRNIGFNPIFVKLKPEVNYAYYFLVKNETR